MKARMIRHAARGFTLLEMMVVLLIIGLLMSVAVINIVGRGDDARKATTIQSMNVITSALKQYQLQHGDFPPTLDALTPKFLEDRPVDAWKRAFVYFPNSATGATSTRPYTLYSKGKGGEEGNSEDVIDYWKEKELASGGPQNP